MSESPMLGGFGRTLTSVASALVWPLIQLSLVLVLIYEYQIENRTFFQIALLAVGGFAVHSVLPLAYRLPFFVLLSFAGIGVAFGLRDGAAMVTAGVILIGVCHLPLSFWARVSLLVGIGAALAFARAGVVASPWSEAVWPILASMFMFRLALYMYALQHDKTPVDPYRSLAYFFMLPNVSFPLFPVVDYGTFARTYYDRDAGEIYQRGVDWIVRGLVQLLLYRFVYLYLTNDPANLSGLGDFVQFVLSTFLLYLRVSGQFHLIVGMLHLFGFRMPETHRLYYLASSFTDFWRRINIYWKDFMMKLVYYPSFFRLRSRGDRTALIGATIAVFFATWILHSYQWFWLRGGFPVTAQDGIFWGGLGALVVYNALREIKRGRKRAVSGRPAWDRGQGARTVLMFWGMTILWSLWSSESVGEWIAMWPATLNVDLKGISLIGGVTVVLFVLGGRDWPDGQISWKGFSRLSPSVANVALLGGLLLVGAPAVHNRIVPGQAEHLMAMKSSSLNTRDAALQQRGYYEQLDNMGRLSAELWTVNTTRPSTWISFNESIAFRSQNSFLAADIEPNTSFLFNGEQFTANQWGMRDKEYTREKPEDTYRIAVVGASHIMGYGVSDSSTIDFFLEQRLNESLPLGPTRPFEVLNFGVGGYSILQMMTLLDERVLEFSPDVVLIALPAEEILDEGLIRHLTTVADSRVPIPYPELLSILGESAQLFSASDEAAGGTSRAFDPFGVRRRMAARELVRSVERSGDDMIEWSFSEMVRTSREANAVPILVTLDLPVETREELSFASGLASSDDVLWFDLFDIYDPYDLTTLRVAPWDNHPNATANEIIADRIYSDLVENLFLSDNTTNP